MDGQKKVPRELAFVKMERLVCDMLSDKGGVPHRTCYSFFNAYIDSFTGKDLAKWLQDRLQIGEIVDAQNLIRMLCAHGYVFSVITKTPSFKADGTLYRIQSMSYWPTRKWEPTTKEYALYLKKKSLKGYRLDSQESVSLSRLEAMFGPDDRLKIGCLARQLVVNYGSKSKADKEIEDSQERAFWRLHRPSPGTVSLPESCTAKHLDCYATVLAKKRKALLQTKVRMYRKALAKVTMVKSKSAQSLVGHCNHFQSHDPLLPAGGQDAPSNPWHINDEDYWELQTLSEQADMSIAAVTSEQVKRWAFDLREVLRDSAGRRRFASFLRQQFCLENLRFWEACEELKRCPQSQLKRKVLAIINNFLREDAPYEVNLHTSHLHHISAELDVQVNTNSSNHSTANAQHNAIRFALEQAQQHIYQLMREDCYPRFLRSDFYLSALHEALHLPPPERRNSLGISLAPGAGHHNGSGGGRKYLRHNLEPFVAPALSRCHDDFDLDTVSDKLVTFPSAKGSLRKMSAPAASIQEGRNELLRIRNQPQLRMHCTNFRQEGGLGTLKRTGSLSSIYDGNAGSESD